MLMRMPDDLFDAIASDQLSFSDLCSLCETSKQTKALVTAFLDREYGKRYERYCRCMKFAHQKTHTTLMRFASPMTLRSWSYRCAGCGRRTLTIETCPICVMRLLSHKRRRTRHLHDLAGYIVAAWYTIVVILVSRHLHDLTGYIVVACYTIVVILLCIY